VRDADERAPPDGQRELKTRAAELGLRCVPIHDEECQDRADIEIEDRQIDVALSSRMGGLWYLEKWI